MRISYKAVAFILCGPPKQRKYVYKKVRSGRPFHAWQSPDRSVAKTNIRFQRFDNLTFGWRQNFDFDSGRFHRCRDFLFPGVKVSGLLSFAT